MAETVVYTPEGNQANNVLPWMLASQNGGLGGGLFGGAGLSAFLGGALGAIFPNFFGWGGNGFGNNGAGAGFISNQLNNDSGRELLMNAITSQGEASRAAIQNLATLTGQDFNLVNADIQTVKSALATLATQQAVSVPQIINSIQSGNAALASQFCQCCCEMRQLVVEQGYQGQIRTMEQTNTLAGQADRNTRAVTDAISAQSIMINDGFCKIQNREYESRIEALKTELANANRAADKAEILGSVSAMLAPIAGQVSSIKQSMPPTVSVPYPQLTAIQTAPGLEYLTNAAILGTLFRNIVSGGATDTTPTTQATTA